jgi:hypothetical protein
LMCRNRYDAFPLKAFAAEYRTPLRRFKRNRGLMATIRAGGAGFRAHRRSTRGPLRLTKLATLGIVPELLVMKEKLFPCGEHKLIPAIHTLENLVDELHLSFPSRTAEIPQRRLQSPGPTVIVNRGY